MEKDFLHHPSSISHPLSLRGLLNESVTALRLAGVPSPEVDARELLLHALGLSRVLLLTRATEVVAEADAAKVRTLITQRSARIPLQHLLGEVEWGGVHLKVDGRALVPRPETEILLELALRAVDGRWMMDDGGKTAHRAPRIASLSTSHKPQATSLLDIGTGTGALALALKHALPHAQVTATDLSADALALARENAALNGLDVQFMQGNLFAGLGGPFDLIVSNPPYLPAADRENADPEVAHDPELALYSGPAGLDLARELVAGAASRLTPGGVLLLELDPRNVEHLAAEMPGWNVEILCDLTGRQRFLRAVRAE